MNYFVLFSAIIIAVSVVILLLPSSNAEEGFTTHEMRRKNPPMSAEPSAAGQRNASGNAGSADGSSDHDHLLDNLLMKHDKLAEAFENRNKTTTAVSSTTTQKKGIASTSGRYKGDRVRIPVAGCNKDKCVEIGPTATDEQGNLIAFRGNCVNPKYYNSDYVNYGIKYCPSFKPADDTIDDQECETCGYYTYQGTCIKKDPSKDVDPTDPNWAPTPNNPSNCDYRDYTFIESKSGPMPGTTSDDGGDQGQGSPGPICSATTCQPKTTQIGDNQCVIPGCYSADDGMMPYPNDFYGNSTINPCIPMKDSTGATNGFMCPAITSGTTYDSGGGSKDLCYMTDLNKDKPNLPPNYIIDRSKFVPMDTVCSNDKPKSKQQFKPGKDAPIDDTTIQRHSHNHKHAGAVNVYHHHMYHGSRSGKNSNKNTNANANKTRGYMEPEAGAGVLGFL
jgi:hypothetical protein